VCVWEGRGVEDGGFVLVRTVVEVKILLVSVLVFVDVTAGLQEMRRIQPNKTSKYTDFIAPLHAVLLKIFLTGYAADNI
jgi:uncharacterized membrane protein